MLLSETALWLLLAALFLDAAVGDPDWLWRRLPHPVVWIGRIISAFDRTLNRTDRTRQQRRARGLVTLIILVLGAGSLGLVLQGLLSALPYGEVLTILVTAVFLAQNSLYTHVAAVAKGLSAGGLEGGRKAVAMIVGRDPAQLDEAGVSRAAIESCAENFSDGVVAPAFWFAVLGLPGLFIYKAVNTADSMIGHKTEKYQDFGWASARFDDLINLPASRLAGLFIAIAAPLARGSILTAFKAIGTDAKKHRSPNAGWPEAAMAGGLDLALAGPRIYPGYRVEDPFMNSAGRRNATGNDIKRALTMLMGAWGVMTLTVLVLANTL